MGSGGLPMKRTEALLPRPLPFTTLSHACERETAVTALHLQPSHPSLPLHQCCYRRQNGTSSLLCTAVLPPMSRRKLMSCCANNMRSHLSLASVLLIFLSSIHFLKHLSRT